MNLNELIIELQKLQKEEHGELPVYYAAYYYEEVDWAAVKGSRDEKYILLDTGY